MVSVITNGRAVPRITSSPLTVQAGRWLAPPLEHSARSLEKRTSGTWPSAVVKMYLRMCSSRRAKPVSRLRTGKVASICSSTIPFGPDAIRARAVTELDLPWMRSAGTLVAPRTRRFPD